MLRNIIPVLFFLLASLPAFAEETQDVRQFVDMVGEKTLEIMNGPAATEQKQAALQQLFTENVNIDWMAQFILGRGWDEVTDEQKSNYLQAYRKYLIQRYTKNLSEYAGSNYTISEVRSEADGQFAVSMNIKLPKQGEQTRAGYRLLGENGQYKIIDIVVEGVSLITTQRSEFASVFKRRGMDGLIDAINAKVR